MNLSDYVKYLCVYLHNNLSWDYQINQIGKKLSCANFKTQASLSQGYTH